MKLRVGLIRESLPWREILAQEGVPAGVVDLNSLSPSEWSVLVVGQQPDGREREAVTTYLRAGGAVLGFSAHLSGICRVQCRSEGVKYLLPDEQDDFFDIGLLDVETRAEIPLGANILRTDANVHAAFAGRLGGGFAVLIPFDPASAMFDTRAATKAFSSVRDRLPAERVSMVGKNELRHLLRRSLEFLHHQRGFPYVHLWYYPRGLRSMFAFRVDTDGAPRHDIEDLCVLAGRYKVPASWFLDVKSHEDWIGWFGSLEHQEMAVHCYQHKAFKEYDEIVNDVTAALDRMKASGLTAGGYAAPFGIWRRETAKMVESLGFSYSSEFSYAYDTFPLHPYIEGILQQAPQVAVHPICIGSMMRVGYSPAQMMSYFDRIIERKLLRDEPLFFYHHPSHRCWDVIEHLFGVMGREGIEGISFEGFASWWERRQHVSFEAEVENSWATVRVGDSVDRSASEVWIEITRLGGRSSLTPLRAGSFELDALPARSTQISRIPSEDLHKTREFDPRAKFAAAYSALIRKLQ